MKLKNLRDGGLVSRIANFCTRKLLVPFLAFATSVGGILAAHADAAANEKISGIHEVIFGVSDLGEAEAYWNRFGFHTVNQGTLTKDEAMALYHVPSAAKILRMAHTNTDHTFVRLWQWENETGPGAGIVPLLTPGTRWVSSYLKNQVEMYYQALADQLAGKPIHIVPPQLHVDGDLPDTLHSGDLKGYAEVVVLTPDYRRVFAQRWGGENERPNFGSNINWDSHYQGSEITHVGLVIESDDPNIFDFYPDVLGIEPRRPEVFLEYRDEGSSWQDIMGNKPGVGMGAINYGNPSDTATDRWEHKSGSLLLRRVLPDPSNPPVEARPGAHGLTLFTYAVADIEAYHGRVSRSAARRVTDVIRNEFGERSFSFIAPDGSDWALVELEQ